MSKKPESPEKPLNPLGRPEPNTTTPRAMPDDPRTRTGATACRPPARPEVRGICKSAEELAGGANDETAPDPRTDGIDEETREILGEELLKEWALSAAVTELALETYALARACGARFNAFVVRAENRYATLGGAPVGGFDGWATALADARSLVTRAMQSVEETQNLTAVLTSLVPELPSEINASEGWPPSDWTTEQYAKLVCDLGFGVFEDLY